MPEIQRSMWIQRDNCAIAERERELIAKKLKTSLREFNRKYVSKIKYKNSIINLLKVGKCPFLENYRCKLEKYDAKLIRCMLYPILIGRKNSKIKIFLDVKGCPLANKFPKVYIKKAINIYKKIRNQIPNYWLEFATKHDEQKYDYKILSKFKNKKIINIKELKNCSIK